MLARILLLLFTIAGAGLAQRQVSGEIRGSVLSFEIPVARAEVEARSAETLRLATTDEDGSYRLLDLPPGTYNLRISALNFWHTEIREVAVEANRAKTLPAIEIDPGFYASEFDTRPAFYREITGLSSTGAVGGAVVSDKGGPISGAEVTLYVRGQGKIGSQKTRPDGSFSFTGLEARRKEYWIRISCAGYFSEEVEHLTALPGLESVYAPLTMESCPPGRCQPHLKTIRVIPPSA